MWRITLTLRRLDWFSRITLITGLVLTFFNPLKDILHGMLYFFVNIILYTLSFGALYSSRKFRQFIIHPTFLKYTRPTTYQIHPWIPEGEIRWPAKLKKITIITSKSLEIKELSLNITKLIENGNPVSNTVKMNKSNSTKTIYTVSFDPPEEIEINTSISFTIEQNEDIDDSRPFLEYTIEYEPPVPLLAFRYHRRIF